MVHICSLNLPPVLEVVPNRYPEIQADFVRSFQTLRSLPADIWLASHAREFGRWRKFTERANAKNPADPFIDRAGYLSAISRAEKRFHEAVGDQQPRP